MRFARLITSVILVQSPLLAEEIKWDADHPVLIKAGGHYGRMARIDARTLISGYDFQRAMHVSLSHDEGTTWEAPVKVTSNPEGSLTNTELLVLKNGEILCFFNFRPNKGTKSPYSIGMSRSRDGAKTWSPPETLFSAGKDFGDGCWEPSAIQLPDGEIQVYFANENPYRKGNEQEISMLRSRDNGQTWDKAETISFRKNSRDGMPGPVVANNGSAIAVAIEDNGLSGTFKPVIVSTRLERGCWRDGVVDGDSPFRWRAHSKPLPPSTYAGAPYLRQFPNGQFILSFQLSESGDMKQSRMAVSLGNDRARDFGEPSFPFPIPTGGAQLWNALFIKNPTTVTAISETSRNGTRGIWAVDGVLHP
jgi:hypothetical protein